jgi:hypothetical protein
LALTLTAASNGDKCHRAHGRDAVRVGIGNRGETPALAWRAQHKYRSMRDRESATHAAGDWKVKH